MTREVEAVETPAETSGSQILTHYDSNHLTIKYWPFSLSDKGAIIGLTRKLQVSCFLPFKSKQFLYHFSIQRFLSPQQSGLLDSSQPILVYS